MNEKAWHRCATCSNYYDEESDAKKCCNGWTRVLVPLFYGQKELLGRVINHNQEPPFWRWILLPDDAKDEIALLRSMYGHKEGLGH